MNKQGIELFAKKLRELADNIESGKIKVKEVSFGRHFEIVTELNKYSAYPTGDDCIQIRIEGMHQVISVVDLEDK